MSVTCPRCGMTSHHPTDVEKGYCANCHDTTSGEFSVLAMADFVRTGELPEWRVKWLESKAVDAAVHEAVEHLRNTQ